VSEREEAGQPQRYCRNCGAEFRPGDAFCASCGTRLTPVYEEEGPRREDSPTTDAPSTSSASILSGETLRHVPQNLLRWFRDLPVALKVAGVVVVGMLLLLILFSPLALVAAMLLLVVSVIAAIKAWQGRSVKGWRIVAVVSFVLTFAFAGVYDALYGSSFNSSTNSTDSRSNKNATKQAAADEKNTQALREAAFRPPPLGVEDQKYIDDLWVTGDTATVEFVKGIVEPGDNFMAAAERVQGTQTCGSTASVVAKNDIPVETVRVISSRDEELAACDVKRRATTGKDKQNQRTTKDRS
jgi:zinc-ribbon domain